MIPDKVKCVFFLLSAAVLVACGPAAIEPEAVPTVTGETVRAGAQEATATAPIATAEPSPTMAASSTPLPTETPVAPAPVASPDGGEEAVEVGTVDLAAVLVRPEQWRPNLGDIAVTAADGSGLKQLTSYRYNADPVLSPDGERIAYRSVPIWISSLAEPGPRLAEGNYNIWVITADGEQAWQLTNSEAVRSVPTWSVDSQRVAFSQGDNGELVEIEVGTLASRAITAGTFDPKYRPDGGGIGFITAEGGLAWIDEAGARHDIVSPTSLPSNTRVNDFDWRPDGQEVIYTLADDSERIGGSTVGIKYSVWRAGLDGSNPATIAEGARNVKVSPDGKRAAVLTGSGYGDACTVDQRLAFLELGTDGELVDMADLAGFPPGAGMGSFYPLANVTWTSGQQALVELGLTCAEDRSPAGMYLIDSQGRQMSQVRSAQQAGEGLDLGRNGEPEAENRLTGIEIVDQAIATILSNDIEARRGLIQYTTAGCTTADGLGGPPKCTADQAEGTPVTYFPLLGPGEGVTVFPENIDDSIDFVVEELYAAVRLAEPAVVDEFYPAGLYGLIFSLASSEFSTGVNVRLDENGRIVRLDFFPWSLEGELEGEGLELLVAPDGRE